MRRVRWWESEEDEKVLLVLFRVQEISSRRIFRGLRVLLTGTTVLVSHRDQI